MLVKIFTTMGKTVTEAQGSGEGSCSQKQVHRTRGGQTGSTTMQLVMSHVGVTTPTGLWDELQPQLCPCKGPLARNMFSLLFHPHVACKNIPIAREQSRFLPFLWHTQISSVNTVFIYAYF